MQGNVVSDQKGWFQERRCAERSKHQTSLRQVWGAYLWLTSSLDSSWIHRCFRCGVRRNAKSGWVSFSFLDNKRKNVTVCNWVLQNSWIPTLQRLDARSSSLGGRNSRVPGRVALKYLENLDEGIRFNRQRYALGFLQTVGSAILKALRRILGQSWFPSARTWRINGLIESKAR